MLVRVREIAEGMRKHWHSLRQAGDPPYRRTKMCAQAVMPSELLDHICGFMDKRSLAACTLVCSDWYISARVLLYHSIILSDDRIDRHTIDTFNTFLASSCASPMRRYIKQLIIRCMEPRAVDIAVIDVYQVELLLSKLPSLQVLHLEKLLLKLPVRAKRGRERPLGRPVSMDKLKLHNVGFELSGPSDQDGVALSHDNVACSIVELLNLFTSLNTLDLFGVWPDSPDSYNLTPHLEHNVRLAYAAGVRLNNKFRIANLLSDSYGVSTHEHILAVLRGSHSLDALRSVVIREDPAHFSQFIQAVSGTLESLRLTIDDVNARFDVACCTRLTHLRVAVIHSANNNISRDLQAVQHVVSAATGTISHLTIHIDRYHWGPEFTLDGCELDWERLDVSLEKHTQLTHVVFILQERHYRVDDDLSKKLRREAELLKAFLPRCEARCRLDLRYQS